MPWPGCRRWLPACRPCSLLEAVGHALKFLFLSGTTVWGYHPGLAKPSLPGFLFQSDLWPRLWFLKRS